MACALNVDTNDCDERLQIKKTTITTKFSIKHREKSSQNEYWRVLCCGGGCEKKNDCCRRRQPRKKTFIRVTSIPNHSKSARVFDILTIQQTNYKIHLYQLTGWLAGCMCDNEQLLLCMTKNYYSGIRKENFHNSTKSYSIFLPLLVAACSSHHTYTCQTYIHFIRLIYFMPS